MTEMTEMLEHKTAPLSFEFKVLSDEGQFQGYAITFGNRDAGGDICLKGCSLNSLRERPVDVVQLLRGHDSDRIIGEWIELNEDERGLFAKGQIYSEIDDGREALLLARKGRLRGLSIGYRVRPGGDEFDPERNARLLKDIDIREISLVTFPMNEQALVTDVKSFSQAIDEIKALSDAERFLREVDRPLSRKEATDFTSVVRKIVQREAGDDRGAVMALNRLAHLMRS